MGTGKKCRLTAGFPEYNSDRLLQVLFSENTFFAGTFTGVTRPVRLIFCCRCLSRIQGYPQQEIGPGGLAQRINRNADLAAARVPIFNGYATVRLKTRLP